MPSERHLPEGVEKYSQSPLFTAASVPDSLKSAHSTKAGTYGRLKVNAGNVKYFLQGQSEPYAVISTGENFIILPTEEHYIKVSDDVEFLVEFCK